MEPREGSALSFPVNSHQGLEEPAICELLGFCALAAYDESTCERIADLRFVFGRYPLEYRRGILDLEGVTSCHDDGPVEGVAMGECRRGREGADQKSSESEFAQKGKDRRPIGLIEHEKTSFRRTNGMIFVHCGE